MHLKPYPQYFVKDSERRAVFFTSEARDLRAMGWAPEKEAKQPATSAPKPIAEAVATEPAESTEKTPDFELMTKTELLSYAMERGVDLKNNAPKAELIEACSKLVG